MDRAKLATFRPEYSPRHMEWVLTNGKEALKDEHGEPRLFLTAKMAYDWIATEAGYPPDPNEPDPPQEPDPDEEPDDIDDDEED